ncbi:alpha/beta hydrolase [Candidatus Neomarinimicrobiota bacterium]
MIHLGERLATSIDSSQFQFFDFLDMVDRAVDSTQQIALIDSFMLSHTANDSFPVVENDTVAHLVYYEPGTESVALYSECNDWPATERDYYSGIGNTGFFHKSIPIESTARIIYRIFVNGRLLLDPLNPDTYLSHSLIVGGCYVPPEEILVYDIPHGIIEELPFDEPPFDEPRTLQVYLPPDYGESQQRYPVMYFHDGSGWLAAGYAANTLDYLIHHGQIRPIMAVFVDSRNRLEEYQQDVYLEDQSFSAHFADDLVPFIDANYRTSTSRTDRAIAGLSLGGAAALTFLLAESDVFGKCAAYSPAIFDMATADLYREKKAPGAQVYLDAGTYEDGLYQSVRELADIMWAKGYEGHFYPWHEGHYWSSWQAHLDIALKYFWPGPG